MKNICILLCLIGIGGTTPKTFKKTTKKVAIESTLDTIEFVYSMPKYFKNTEERILFVKYIKTQANYLHIDNWYVIQTMFNRMDWKGCTWKEYYDNPHLNHSQTIKKMKKGKVVGFNPWSKLDSTIYSRVRQVEFNTTPDSLKIPKDICFFESFKISPNKGCFKLKNLFTKQKHKFYINEEI